MTFQNKIYCFLICQLCIGNMVAKAQKNTKHDKPNIIFILADDLGYETLEANGGSSYKTPHVDQLAQSGMRFTNCNATPLCTPSRVQLMTGKYNFRNYKGFGILDPSDITFGNLLKQAGYVTGITGKWQLLGSQHQQDLAGQKGTYPQKAGFDKYFVWQVETPNSPAPRYKNPVIYTSEGNKSFPGKYGPDLFADYAKKFIEQNRDTTFFLYYPMVLTHDPFQPTPDNNNFVTAEPKNTSDTAYFRYMVEYMDKKVGEIINKVKEEGLSRKTLIIFSGDNGTSTKIVSILNGKKVRGAKGFPTVYGTHVPLIAYWDGVIKPGQLNNNLIDFTDFIPTFLETAGEKIPSDFHTDGTSFYKQLLNKKNAKKRDWVFCSYAPNWGSFKPYTWIQDKQWKLYKTGEFFNLQKDPDEKDPIQEAKLTAREKTDKEKLKKAMMKILQ